MSRGGAAGHSYNCSGGQTGLVAEILRRILLISIFYKHFIASIKQTTSAITAVGAAGRPGGQVARVGSIDRHRRAGYRLPAVASGDHASYCPRGRAERHVGVCGHTGYDMDGVGCGAAGFVVVPLGSEAAVGWRYKLEFI